MSRNVESSANLDQSDRPHARIADLDAYAAAALDRLTRWAAKGLSAPAALICLGEDGHDEIASCTSSSAEWASRTGEPLVRLVATQAARTRDPLVIGDVAQLASRVGAPPRRGRLHQRAARRRRRCRARQPLRGRRAPAQLDPRGRRVRGRARGFGPDRARAARCARQGRVRDPLQRRSAGGPRADRRAGTAPADADPAGLGAAISSSSTARSISPGSPSSRRRALAPCATTPSAPTRSRVSRPPAARRDEHRRGHRLR